MKKITIGVVALMCIACGGKMEKPGKIEERAYQLTSDVKTGTNVMQSSTATGDVTIGGEKFHYSIKRRPDETLPKVKNEEGSLFVDNAIALVITGKGNRTVVDKRFNKLNFADHVDPAFLKQAILEGLVFDKEEGGKMLFLVSVCYPQTDLFVPLRLTVSTNGSMTISEAGNIYD